jgi:hypothetical protein
MFAQDFHGEREVRSRSRIGAKRRGGGGTVRSRAEIEQQRHEAERFGWSFAAEEAGGGNGCVQAQANRSPAILLDALDVQPGFDH